MKARGAKRAKFRVGQVVAFRKEHPMRSIWFGKIRAKTSLLYNVDGYAVHGTELRPLTAKEAGHAK